MRDILPRGGSDWALFLDVDGTMLEFAPVPEAVTVSPELPARLDRLARRFGGALALVSGRSLADLDRLFLPFRFPAAGVHGAERRDAGGRLHYTGLGREALDPVRAELARFAADHPGVLIEDKGLAVALHFRQAPHAESAARVLVETLLASLPAGAGVQAGHCVLELKGRDSSKRAAVEAFMREGPFTGRVPVYVGDDLTDLDALAFAETAGGHGIFVGREARPGWGRLPDPAAVREWLKRLDTL